MSINKNIQLGLCCLNITLKNQKVPIYPSRKMAMKTIKEKGIKELKRRITLNLKDLLKMMDWNEKNGIKVFRLSSEMFFHKTNKRVENYTYDFALDLLKKIGKKSKKYKQRLTYHPGQYNVIASPNKKAYLQTIDELSYHADIFDLMGLDKNSVIVIHGGGLYNDKIGTMKRWCVNYKKLDKKIKKRLVLENCEKCFSIKDCLEISEKTGIPVVFDTHHFECYKLLHPKEKFENAKFYIPKILKTWEKRGIKPKFHVSEQGEGRIGKHSDYIKIIPQYLLDIPEKYGNKIDIMIEAKKKELAIFELYKKYPFFDCKIKKK